MDYYEPMELSQRFWRAVLVYVIAAAAWPAQAQTSEPAARAESPVEAEDSDANAALNAELFYELLLGEMTTSAGDPGTGYNLILDAARRSGDAQLYRRATDIALQARSGEYALAAARAWQQALPRRTSTQLPTWPCRPGPCRRRSPFLLSCRLQPCSPPRKALSRPPQRRSRKR